MIEVVAKYSAIRVVLITLLILALSLFLYYLPLSHSDGVIAYLESEGPRAFVIIVCWIGMPFGVYLCLRIMAQVIFKSGAAVWLDGADICFLVSSWTVQRLDRRQIEDVFVSRARNIVGTYEAVTIMLRNGDKKEFSAKLLSCPSAELVSRLKRVIAS